MASSTARSAFWKSSRLTILVERLPMPFIMPQLSGHPLCSLKTLSVLLDLICVWGAGRVLFFCVHHHG